MGTLKAAATAIALAAALIAMAAAPAQARQVVVSDPSGDTSSPGLDFTSAAFHNRDRAIVTTFTFASDRRGVFFIGVKARTGPAVAIISRHRRTGPDKVFVVSRSGAAPAPCARVSSDWSRASATVRLRLPARCLDDGNYGAVRFFAFSEEAGGGADIDFAPQKPNGNRARTPWVPRG